MSSGVKFRCYPNPEQEKILSEWIGCQRVIYNAKVAEDRYFRTFRNHSLSLTGYQIPVDQKYSQFKDRELTPFLYKVPSEILRNGATRFMQAYRRYYQGLANHPSFKKKNGRQTVWLTKELFRFEPDNGHNRLFLGTKSHPVGELKFKAHTDYDLPASLTISRQAGKWFVSFSNTMPEVEISEADLVAHFSSMSASELEPVTLGADRGTVIPLKTSDGESYDFSEIQKQRLRRKEINRKRYERRMARRQKDSKRRQRAAQKIAAYHAYVANVRQDFAHKTSRKLVNSEKQVFVFEDLPIKNMTKAPPPRQDENGKYIKNGAAAKAGLNKAILNSAWGKVKQFTAYKALRQGKLLIVIPPQGTSQECSACQHTHPDNRRTQAEFVCTRCGLTINADYNAALVIKRRGIQDLISGRIVVKEKKRVMRLKKHPDVGREPAEFTRGETNVSRSMGQVCRPQLSVNRETPTTTALAD
ncbi:MAG: transposase [Deltaproteobacteria bacterium]|nr:transposase [Deltaproteobacteria bacterium]